MRLIQGDCLVEMQKLEDNSVDSIVVDPPYGISFMGKKWDYNVPKVEVWQEALRVLKAGGHALVACGTRTQHRMAVNLEDAGFEIRDIVAWIYGSGFPKSHNIGKAVDKLQGNEREVLGTRQVPDQRGGGISSERTAEKGGVPTRETTDTKGNSKYEGWGTALKPAMELWTLCRKPLEEKTVAQNVLKHGTGGINIDGCRVGSGDKLERTQGNNKDTSTPNAPNNGWESKPQTQGRFPANLIHDGSDEVVGLFPDSNGSGKARKLQRSVKPEQDGWGMNKNSADEVKLPDAGSGSASRFFYCAKASKSERNKGLEGFEEKKTNDGRNKEIDNAFQRGSTLRNNNHPTVKPIALMSYLCRLITPKGGTILDPFMGSGSTGIGAKLENFNFIGIELDEDYFNIAKSRIENYIVQTELEF